MKIGLREDDFYFLVNKNKPGVFFVLNSRGEERTLPFEVHNDTLWGRRVPNR